MKLREDDLEIDFTDAIDGFVFDQMDRSLPNYHGIGEMCRVDFIVEFAPALVFVEIKDPANPRAQKRGLKKFENALNGGSLSSKFANKFVDSFLYRWAENCMDKPVHYLSLVTIDAALLPNFSDEIGNKMPPLGNRGPRWQRAIVENCQVFNIDTWNENFPKWPVTWIAPAAVNEGAPA